MRIICYVRLSTREQAENSNALTQQIARVKQAASCNDPELFIDIASGSDDKREHFKKLLELVKTNQVQEVICTRLDRLTRKLSTVITIRDVFLASSCNLRILDDSIDIQSPGGRFHLGLLGGLSEMEVDRLSQRIKAGVKHSREMKRISIAPLGYCVIDGKLVIDEEPILCLIDRRREVSNYDLSRYYITKFIETGTSTKTLRAFNEHFGVRRFKSKKAGRSSWGTIGIGSATGLIGYLNNPVIRGHTFYKATGETTYNTHYAILSYDEYTLIQLALKQSNRVRGYGTRYEPKHAVGGLCVCDACKSYCYSVRGGRSKNLYYQTCPNWRTRACSQNKSVRVEKIEDAIIEALTTKAHDLATMADVPEIPATSNEIDALNQQLIGLQQLGSNPAISNAIKELQRQIESLTANLGASNQQHESKRELLIEVFRDKQFYTQLSLADKIRIYRELVSKVLVRGGAVVTVELSVDLA